MATLMHNESVLINHESSLTKYKPFMTARGIKWIYLALRKYRGWSRIQVARKAAISTATLERIERGREPSKDQVVMLDKVYGCNGDLIDYWLGRIKLSYGKIKKAATRAVK